MAINLHFVLKDSKAKQETSIFLRFKIKGKRFTWSLGQERMIHPELWDSSRQRPIHTQYSKDESQRSKIKYAIKKFEITTPTIKTDLENIKSRIENVSFEVKKFITRLEKNSERFDYDELKSNLNEKYTPKKKAHQKRVEEAKQQFITPYFEYFVDGIVKGDILQDFGANHGQRFSLGTIKTYKTSLRKWKEFESHIGRKIRWTDFDNDLYDSLLNCYNAQNLSGNYIGRIVKHIKVIYRRSYEKGIHHSREYTKRYFKAREHKVDAISLSLSEIESIRLCDLSEYGERYELYRDVFLCGCYTALRYSDYSRIRPEHIKGNFLDIINKKTKKRVKIPIHPNLRIILNKYQNTFPRTYPQHLNEIIKEIGKMAGINEMWEYKESKGGMMVLGSKPRYDLIKSHTARRTGATLMYLATNDALGVMKITGHATESDFMRYIKIDIDENAERMRQSSFFSPRLKKRQ